VCRHAAVEWPLAVLDLGCGTGEPALELARVLPRATVLGVDISARSIAVARKAAAERGLDHRIAFEAGDYMAVRGGPFDLIVADGVLQLIAAPTERLVAKLAAELVPGGVLVYALPSDTAGNRARALLRRALGLARGRATDAALLAMAHWFHGARYDRELLRERIPYLYEPPRRYDSARLHRLFRAAGFSLVARRPAPPVSRVQMRCAEVVLRKRWGSGPAGADRAA
jgi:cyclopropane fatty-acyl-phospholipid synthase-like methyltransferase